MKKNCILDEEEIKVRIFYNVVKIMKCRVLRFRILKFIYNYGDNSHNNRASKKIPFMSIKNPQEWD